MEPDLGPANQPVRSGGGGGDGDGGDTKGSGHCRLRGTEGDDFW